MTTFLFRASILLNLALIGLLLLYRSAIDSETEFSRSYSEDAFQGLSCKDSADDVIKRIGLPLSLTCIHIDNNSGDKEGVVFADVASLSTEEFLKKCPSDTIHQLWGFSRAKDHGNYEQRILYFDSEGAMLKKSSESYRD